MDETTSDGRSILLFDAFRSVCGPRQGCYVAGPIEHCREFYSMAAPSSRKAREDIIRRNRHSLRDFATELRGVLPHPVIDPGLLIVPGWTGADYGRFFIAVLDELCKELRLADGWEYSLGATKELVVGYQLGLTCYDRAGVEMLPTRAADLVEIAADFVEVNNVTEPRFKRRVHDLRRVAEGEAVGPTE